MFYLNKKDHWWHWWQYFQSWWYNLCQSWMSGTKMTRFASTNYHKRVTKGVSPWITFQIALETLIVISNSSSYLFMSISNTFMVTQVFLYTRSTILLWNCKLINCNTKSPEAVKIICGYILKDNLRSQLTVWIRKYLDNVLFV